MTPGAGPNGLPVIYRARVGRAWIDRNGHFNAGYYMVAFDEALTGWHDHCGLDTPYRQTCHAATFTVEGHVTYERELREGDPLVVSAQLLGFADKKIHSFLRMHHAEEAYLAATNELLSLHIDMRTRRTASMAESVLARLAEIYAEHARLPIPPQAGRVISVNARRPDGGPSPRPSPEGRGRPRE